LSKFVTFVTYSNHWQVDNCWLNSCQLVYGCCKWRMLQCWHHAVPCNKQKSTK